MRTAARRATTLVMPLTLAAGALSADPPGRPDPRFVVEAAHRFLPTQHALVAVRTLLTEAGAPAIAGGTLALYRVLDPYGFALGPLARDDRHFAVDPIGREMERLLVGRTPLPRRGALLELQRVTRVGALDAVRGSPDGRSDLESDLGALPTGLYLARLTAGGWSATGTVSVGALALLVRRGDGGDRVFVTDGDGAPQAGVTVLRRAGVGRAEGRTDAAGSATFAATGELTARFVASRGDDVTTADVAHADEAPCDVRVYLDTGRRLFFANETMHLRAHVRGCVGGLDRPMADEPVELRAAGQAPVTVRTDRDGNLVADVPVGCVRAAVRGREHTFCARWGAPPEYAPRSRRRLRPAPPPAEVAAPEGASPAVAAPVVVPPRLLSVRTVAARVRLGEPVEVDLHAPAGGATLLTLEQGGVLARLDVARAGASRVSLPTAGASAGYASVVATRVVGGAVSTASARLWLGASPNLDLRVATDAEQVRRGGRVRVTVRVRDADGAPRDPVLSLWVSDARWWAGAEEPVAPGEYLRRPERRTDPGEGDAPGGPGADEGRRHDPWILWNGRRLPHLGYRDTWSSLEPNLNLDASGTFATVAQSLAAAMGLLGADVCAARERSLGAVRLRVREVPEDLALARIGDATRTVVSEDEGRLVFECPVPSGPWGDGYGSGAGRGLRNRGTAGPVVRSERRRNSPPEPGLFVGTRRAANGEAVFDLAAPDAPGFVWRVEVLAIDDDGSGARAHASFETY